MTSPLILASGSARRQRLLKQAGVRFDTIPADVDETRRSRETGTALARRLAVHKARKVAADHAATVVLGCDTVVTLDDQVMGKPVDEQDALTTLLSLSQRRHQVLTGFCLMRGDSLESSAVVATNVFMKRIDADAARSYIKSGEPFGKAGSYAIQGEGGGFVDHIEGSYSNVMGLPIAEVLAAIETVVPEAIVDAS